MPHLRERLLGCIGLLGAHADDLSCSPLLRLLFGTITCLNTDQVSRGGLAVDMTVSASDGCLSARAMLCSGAYSFLGLTRAHQRPCRTTFHRSLPEIGAGCCHSLVNGDRPQHSGTPAHQWISSISFLLPSRSCCALPTTGNNEGDVTKRYIIAHRSQAPFEASWTTFRHYLIGIDPS